MNAMVYSITGRKIGGWAQINLSIWGAGYIYLIIYALFRFLPVNFKGK